MNISSMNAERLIRQGWTRESVLRAVQTGDLRLLRRKPEDDDGTAGVREPRRPITPLVSGAAEMEADDDCASASSTSVGDCVHVEDPPGQTSSVDGHLRDRHEHVQTL